MHTSSVRSLSNKRTDFTCFLLISFASLTLIDYVATGVPNSNNSTPTRSAQLTNKSSYKQTASHQSVIYAKPPGPALSLALQATVAANQQEPPEFLGPIENQTVALGREAQFSCKIKNLNQYRTAWLRVEDKGILSIHGNTITRNYRIGLIHEPSPASENFVLTIKNVQPSDKGGYMCQINTIPMKFITGYLDVLTPPVFLPLPASTSAGSPQEEHMDDQGSKAGQEAGPSDLVTIQEGANATLHCKASGHPEPLITWRREDQAPIIVDGRQPEEAIAKFEGSSLSLSQVSRLSAGAYLCIASNGVQPSASRRQVLELHFKPVIRLPQKEVAGWPGQAEVRLVCYVELLPTGTYHWLRVPANLEETAQATSAPMDELAAIEHDELANSDKFEIQNKLEGQQQQGAGQLVRMSLIIRRLEKRDFGAYKCLARNSMGHQSNTVRLNQVAAPATPAVQPASPSSSFSFSNLFRGASSSVTSPPTTESPEDISSSPGHGSRQRPFLGSSRNHPRSWNQRSSQTRQTGTADPVNAGQSSGSISGLVSQINWTMMLLTLMAAHQLARQSA